MLPQARRLALFVPRHPASMARMASTQNDRPARGQPFRLRSLILPAYLPTFLFAVGQGAVIPMIVLFATRELGATAAVAAVIFALRGFGTMAFDVPAGMLVSRFGDRTAMIAGTVALGIVAIGAAMSPSVPVYAALIFLMGATWSIWLLARLTYISELAPVEHRGRALALMGGTNRAGHLVGPIIGGFLAVWVGLASAFYLQAGLAVVAVGVMLLFVRDTRPAGVGHDETAYQRLLGVIRDHRRIFVTAGMVATALQVVRTGRQVLIPLWGDALGLGADEIGLIFGLSAAIDMAMFYPVGMIMDRLGRKWAAVPSLVTIAAGLIIIPLVTGFGSLLLVGLLLGLGNGLGTGVVATLGADFSPPGARGEFLGVWRLVGDIGGMAGPMGIGVLTGVASLAIASMAVGGLGLVGALVMIFLVPEPLRRGRYSVRTRPGGG